MLRFVSEIISWELKNAVASDEYSNQTDLGLSEILFLEGIIS